MSTSKGLILKPGRENCLQILALYCLCTFLTPFVSQIFFVLCLVLGPLLYLLAVGIIPGCNHLRLCSDGFEICQWFNKRVFFWHEIKRLRFVTIDGLPGLGSQTVVGFVRWVRVPDRTSSQSHPGEVSEELPDSYGLTAEALITLMEQFRAAAPHPTPDRQSDRPGFAATSVGSQMQ